MAGKHRIMIVDDDEGLLRLLELRLISSGYEVKGFESAEEALNHVALYHPHVVITDLRMSGLDGMALFDALHADYPTLPVIILTAHGTIQEAVEATRRGVFSFLTKPFDSKELLEHIEKALLASGVTEVASDDEQDWRKPIVSQSPVMEDLLRQAKMIAQSEASVFIHGESGTGKELVARAIHNASGRKGAFVPVNCAAIPENLLESELFGHKKGAFTGAASDYQGLFRAADGGTLFLDEIGDMPPAFQVKLLRALQEGQVRPVGGTQSVSVNVRVISATHRNIDQLMAEGLFREDLYYRLNVVTLDVPSLKQRREDVPLLVSHFIQQHAEHYGSNVQSFSPEAMELLISHDWPGNVRQLHNVVEQTVALATTPVIPATLVQKAFRDRTAQIPSFAEARQKFERDYLTQLLRITSGNVSQAARLAQRNRTEFYKLLGRYQLNPSMFKSD